MRVGIFGSGLMGGKLGTIFAALDMTWYLARTQVQARAVGARRPEAKRAPGRQAEAVKQADAVFVKVNWPRVDDVLNQAWIVPIPGTTKLHPLEENIGAVASNLRPAIYAKSIRLFQKITVKEARLPGAILRMSGP